MYVEVMLKKMNVVNVKVLVSDGIWDIVTVKMRLLIALEDVVVQMFLMNVTYVTDQVLLNLTAIVKAIQEIVQVSVMVKLIEMNAVYVKEEVLKMDFVIVKVTEMIVVASVVMMVQMNATYAEDLVLYTHTVIVKIIL